MFKKITTLALLALLSGFSTALAQEQHNLFFLHHSTGRHLLAEGEVRTWIDQSNQEHGTHFVLWDHDYNAIGLHGIHGETTGRCYDIPADNTDPDGLFQLWTTQNSARDSILANHEIIAFKSCFPASAISSDYQLEQRKNWYLQMRDFFDTHPEKTFVVMSQPPLHRLATNTSEADRARAFANWLTSDEFTQGHDNIVCFDLFDLWAQADDGSEHRNMLRYEYELSHSSADSHPNPLANETVGPLFADFLTRSARVPTHSTSLGSLRAFYR